MTILSLLVGAALLSGLGCGGDGSAGGDGGGSGDGAIAADAGLDGSASDGSGLDGSASDGSALDGAASDGSALDGSASDGSASDGAALDGAASDGGAVIPATPLLAAGRAHACVGVSGEVFCWGANDSGQLGDGTNVDSLTAVPVGLTGVVELVAAGDHSCARLTSGDVYCWGEGSEGELGTGQTRDQNTPTLVAAGLPALQVAVGGGVVNGEIAHEGLICLRSSAGALRCAGSNTTDALLTGDARRRSTPLLLGGLPAFVDVAVGIRHVCGLDTDGQVWCWGGDAYLQLFDIRTPPAIVGGLSGVTAIEASGGQTCALRG
ncbi:MAG: hypothetical protein OEY14_13385, partial [Myxococcales bacterium]|nr:hypothetical protein [Myxococcales bacterium]